MTTNIKEIILVDDHVIIREGLKELIEKLGAYKVTRQYSDGSELTNDIPLIPAPDLIIMDISMPVMNGDEVVATLREKDIFIPILILTLSQDENRIVHLFRNGVCGYLKKDCTAAMMKQALEEIFRVGYYHNELMVFALQTAERMPRKTQQELILEKLSVREKEFLKLICHEDEYTYDQIASLMHVQHRTVDGYRQSIFEKFGIKSKTGLVLFMLRHQLYEQLG
ncbi:hypothetical protein CJD36_018705 [Flavipsychrobacter stenotrophus]|uniref:Response regulatory domain-containing protein n=1 Tax=Flavipsychrobacter stenotrophus TaxID=2077091 RepID=A0A2S7SRL9_9BACT|nr:response regulator transcription factor [Flavipsychrobacter stenotrophus]PQJ09281.1 hypothetical protein CJD36_018705 [Flavipsychrobacter stenotrophus]